jgi:effector-binding domain-containing protein
MDDSVMSSACDLAAVAPVILAVTPAMTTQSEIPTRIPPMFDVVYAWLARSQCTKADDNYVVYDQFGRGGMRMQVGFPVTQRFVGDDQIVCFEIQPGRAAHTRHLGPYSGLRAANTELNDWCAQRRLQLAGVSWEVYGDWNDDQSKLVTDIYFRLK